MMRRHELDPISLTFGFAFTGLGLLLLFGQADQALRLRWIWPLLLGVLGVGILLDLTRGAARSDTIPEPVTTPEPATAPTPVTDPEPDTTTADLDPAPNSEPGSEARPAVDNREHPS